MTGGRVEHVEPPRYLGGVCKRACDFCTPWPDLPCALHLHPPAWERLVAELAAQADPQEVRTDETRGRGAT